MEPGKNKNSLPEGYLLHWYEIKRVIGQGGFGITYLAHDNNLDRYVAIKEFLPEDFATRESDSTVHPKTGEQKELYEWGLERFVTEARTLAKFNHPNIVRVLSVFEENNTAYMIMEYAHGEDLSFIYKKNPKFTEEQFLDTFIPIMDGLALIHNAGFIHRDIKPANIYICDDHSPLLLDFGSARQSIGGKTKALTGLVTFGYAPYEQYNEGSGKQGAWTDIYALGASIYVGITGDKPIDALCRGGSFLETGLDAYQPVSVLAKGEYSENFLLAVDNALMFKIDDRPQNIMLWADMLLGKTQAPQLPEYMLKPAIDDKTIIRPGPATKPGGSTAPSQGSQGLVDAHGKRNSSIAATTLLNKEENTAENSAPLDIILDSTGNSPTNHGDRLDSKLSIIDNHWLAITAVSAVIIILLIFISWFYDEPSTPQTAETTQPVQQPLTQQAAPQKTQKDEQLEQFLSDARQAFSNENYITPEHANAFYLYQQVLKIKPDNQPARQGIKDIEQQLLELADTAYVNEQYDRSLGYLAQLTSIKPESLDAKSLRDKIDEKKSHDSQIVSLLDKAKAQRKNNRYTSPKDDNAYLTYNEILKLDAGNEQALDGIKSIQWHYKSQFKQHLSGNQLGKAERDITIMKNISAPPATIEQMQTSLKQRQQKKTVTKTKRIIHKPVDIHLASQKIGHFKEAIQTRNKNKLTELSEYIPGRKQFIDKLFNQHQRIDVKISDLHLIAKENTVKARVELINLIDIHNKKVKPGDWSKFEISVRQNNRQQLRIYW